MHARLACLGLIILYSLPGLAGESVHDYQLSDLDGQLYRASDYRGRWLVINFWANWCPPCLKEMPERERFYRDNRQRAMLWGSPSKTKTGPGSSSSSNGSTSATPCSVSARTRTPATARSRFCRPLLSSVRGGLFHRRFDGPVTTGQLEQTINGE